VSDNDLVFDVIHAKDHGDDLSVIQVDRRGGPEGVRVEWTSSGEICPGDDPVVELVREPVLGMERTERSVDDDLHSPPEPVARVQPRDLHRIHVPQSRATGVTSSRRTYASSMGLVDLLAGHPRATPHSEALAHAQHGVAVYWRPGCPFSGRLRVAVRGQRDDIAWVNIWEDDAGRAYVASVNEGIETVPTVVIDGTAHTNPRPALVKRALGAA
jgi:glutaredoxin